MFVRSRARRAVPALVLLVIAFVQPNVLARERNDSAALDAARQGTKQPTREGVVDDKSKTKNEQSDDEAKELKALLSSPDAMTVAGLQCVSGQPSCPLTDAAQDEMCRHFNDTLLTGSGTDTPLAATLKDVLKNPEVWPARTGYAAVHLVREDAESVRDRWVLAVRRRGTIVLASGRRILGAREMAFVFVHVNVPRAGKTTLAELQDKYADLELRAIVKSKLPANVEHLIALLKITGAQVRAAQTAGLLGFGTVSDVHVPSDITAFAVRSAPLLPVGHAVTFDNEGKYFWDVTVGVPVNKMSLLEYSDANGAFAPKVVNKQSVYGMVNLYPWPVDIKSGTARWLMPRAVIGLGLTGRPGDNFLLGGAWGLPQLQFFVGSGFATHRELKAGSDPANGSNYTQKYSSRLTYGINIPVLSALKKVGHSVKTPVPHDSTVKGRD